MKLHTTDEWGVKNYSTAALFLFSVLGLYTSIALLATILWHAEAVEGSNILTYADAFWTMQMSASTIGFGDHYPITLIGRSVVAVMFYVGVGVVGFIGALIANSVLGFSDTNVKNRELRKQAEENAKQEQLERRLILKSVKALDAKIEEMNE